MTVKALVTGASGFVGANLARRLLEDGHEVHVLVRPGFRPWRLREIADDLVVHDCAVEDERVAEVVEQVRAEWIFHLAVHGAYSDQRDVRQMIATNIVGTINLIDACLQAGFGAFVNTGSSSEYGFKDQPPSESELLEPNSHYAVTKASATLFTRHAAHVTGRPMPTLRLYSVYGPYEEPTRLMPTVVERGLAGELPPLVDPDVARDYVYVSDVVDAYILAATRGHADPGAVYNVGTGVQTTLREVVEVARRVLDIGAEPEWGSMPRRVWDTIAWVADNARIRSELGWSPDVDFVTGFRRMVEWRRSRDSTG